MGDRIRIRYLEAAFLQVVAVIEERSAHEKRALRIDHHADIRGLDHDVAIRRAIHEIHLVLQAGAAAADDRHAERSGGAALFFRSELSLREAFSVTLIRRSLPIL